MYHRFIIILLLTTMSIRPAFFVGNVVYYETHLNEIIDKYCVNKDKPKLQCNGQCHLAKETSSIHTSENSDIITEASLAFFPVYFQELNQTKILAVITDVKESFFTYEFTYNSLISNTIHKPPMV